jgi:hypothetical protein
VEQWETADLRVVRKFVWKKVKTLSKSQPFWPIITPRDARMQNVQTYFPNSQVRKAEPIDVYEEYYETQKVAFEVSSFFVNLNDSIYKKLSVQDIDPAYNGTFSAHIRGYRQTWALESNPRIPLFIR